MWNKILLILLLVGCTPSGEHRPVQSPGADLQAGTKTYEQVRPIFANYCSTCHPARKAPDWLNQSEAKAFMEKFPGRLFDHIWVKKDMPPPGTPWAVSLSKADRESLAQFANPNKGQALASTGSAAPSETAAGAAQSCLQCHGIQRPSDETQRRIAKIRGQSKPYLKEQLRKFKWRERIDPTNTMNDVASSLSDKEVEEVAAFFSKPVAGTPRAEDELPKLNEQELSKYNEGKEYAEENCVSCHLNSENKLQPISPEVPVLAKQAKQYLIDQLLAFRSDEKRSPLMHEFAKSLTNDDIEALALYFSIVNDD